MGGFAGRKSGYQQIHDHIYVRAIVISDGTKQAALLAWELAVMPTHLWEELSQRVSKELGIPAENVIFAAVHDHSAPAIAGMFGPPPAAGAPAGANRAARAPSPGTVAYTTKVENDAFEAVRRAQASLQPAKFGFGTGQAYVNVNRREYIPQKGWYRLGYNPEGPSDKTVAVLKFTALSGQPIALFVNYAVHCVVMGPDNLAVTGDLAGATSRYLEHYYHTNMAASVSSGWEMEPRPEEHISSGEGPVVIWTSGAAGDQAPISRDPAGDFTMVDGLGRILGEESVRVANSIAAMSSEASIESAQRVISCPGRRVEAGDGGPSLEYKFDDADPVSIRLSLIRLNNVALAGVSGEVFTHISQHLKRVSPVGDNTVMVTHANGSSGYIPSDDSFQPISYEVTASHLKPGCAENGIVNGFLEMMAAQ
jgi:hypothetical protein